MDQLNRNSGGLKKKKCCPLNTWSSGLQDEAFLKPVVMFVTYLKQNGVSSPWMHSTSVCAVELLVFCCRTWYNIITLSRVGHVCQAGYLSLGPGVF